MAGKIKKISLMKGRSPTSKEKEHMAKVRELGCIVCRKKGFYYVPSEIHHIEGKTKEGAHFLVLPLCFEHHRRGGDKEPISRHPYKRKFVEAYGSEYELLEEVNSLIVEDIDHLPF